MVQKIFACSRSEQMLQVRFKCWNSREYPAFLLGSNNRNYSFLFPNAPGLDPGVP